MSNLKLWEIPKAAEDIMEMLVDPETGEILSDDEAYELLSNYIDEADKKTEWIAKEIKNLKAEAEALREQKRTFDQRIKAAENKAERLKNYLNFALNGEKWKADDGSITISYRTSSNVVKVTELDSIEEKYFKTPHTESNLNKTMIKSDLLHGVEVPGAELIDKRSVIVK